MRICEHASRHSRTRHRSREKRAHAEYRRHSSIAASVRGPRALVMPHQDDEEHICARALNDEQVAIAHPLDQHVRPDRFSTPHFAKVVNGVAFPAGVSTRCFRKTGARAMRKDVIAVTRKMPHSSLSITASPSRCGMPPSHSQACSSPRNGRRARSSRQGRAMWSREACVCFARKGVCFFFM